MKKIDDKYFIALSDHLIDLIEKKGLDVADIAAAANLDRRQIYRLINKENIPKLSTLIRIILAAGIDPKVFFDVKFNYKEYMKHNSILIASPKKERP